MPARGARRRDAPGASGRPRHIGPCEPGTTAVLLCIWPGRPRGGGGSTIRRHGLGAPLEPQARSPAGPTRHSGGGAEKVPKCCLVLGFSSGAAIFEALPIVPHPGGVVQGCRVRRCPCAPSPARPKSPLLTGYGVSLLQTATAGPLEGNKFFLLSTKVDLGKHNGQGR